jgi:hypothetical protein
MTMPELVALHAPVAMRIRSEVDDKILDMSGRLMRVIGAQISADDADDCNGTCPTAANHSDREESKELLF